MTPVIRKVVAYITRGRDLLVFEHVGQPDAGLQVPAGTVRPSEDLAMAVLREVYEETGLRFASMPCYLGHRRYDARASHGQLHKRHFFHLLYHAETPESWIHHELHDGLQPPTAFRFAWIALDDPTLELIAEFGAMLADLPSPL